MAVRFGTDGIRGVANSELTPELVLALGRATARVLPAERFVVGRDTRRSGPLLQAALSAGLAGEGADVVDVGVLSTPGVAWIAARRTLPAAVVSASHNPFADNGIKVFAPGGVKLPDATEEAIEEELERIVGGEERPPRAPIGPGVGRLLSEPAAVHDYVDYLVGVVDAGALVGLTIVVDAANGAACDVAPEVLRRLGADVHAIGCEADGTNINDGCGSTHPEALAAEVVARHADIGLALDGDADRLVAVDASGGVASGDELLALFAADLSARGRLAGNTVAVTVMSNLGFHQAMAARGIEVRQTPVGDRYVLEALDADGLALGGEQSGHIVFRELATTGDGLLTGVLLADLVRRSDRPLAELAAASMRRVPQLLENIHVPDPAATVASAAVADAIAEAEAALGSSGRVLLRASGTEPLVRVMIEAEAADEAQRWAERLRGVVEAVAASATTGRDPTGVTTGRDPAGVTTDPDGTGPVAGDGSVTLVEDGVAAHGGRVSDGVSAADGRRRS